MDHETAKITRQAQVLALAELLEVPASGPAAWADRYAEYLPTSLQVTVDGGFRGLTVGTLSARQEDIAAARLGLPNTASGAFAAALASDASTVTRVATFNKAGEPSATGAAFSGVWSVDTVIEAGTAAGLSAVDLEAITRAHKTVAGGVVGGVGLDGGGLYLEFGVAVPAEVKYDAADAIVSVAKALQVTALQQGLVVSMMDAWTPRALNFLTLRFHFVDDALRPGFDIGFHDVPSAYAVVGLQTGRPHPRSGALFGAVEGVLMPDRPAATRFFFELGPTEPARVTATLESSGVNTDG